MKQNLRSLCVSLIAAFALAGTVVAQDYFANFPIKADPKGRQACAAACWRPNTSSTVTVAYTMLKCVLGTGAYRFAEMTNDQDLIKKLRNRFELLFHLEKELLPPPIHVDQNMFGCLPL